MRKSSNNLATSRQITPSLLGISQIDTISLREGAAFPKPPRIFINSI